MLFNSLIFLLFASVFLFLRPFFNRAPLNLRLSFILCASLFFYGWWNVYYVPLMLVTGLIDYAGALAIVKWKKHRTFFLSLSLAANLGILFYFKYLLFFTHVWADITGIKWDDLTENIVLPIGLSFYTFQSMSYTIDVYRGRMSPTANPLLFFSFISFFPHLVAGPIVRAREILPQLKRVRLTNEAERYNGVKLIIVGFFKKTVLADHLGPFVNEAFGAAEVGHGTGYWWLAVLAFTFQIYCDFSGYSDIARGLAKCMGIHFRMNFNHPYGSVSFKQFWSRWHISLSSWFRDYVYIALGGNRKGKVRGHVNMWITMLASGLWHGANYTFIIWGGLHAFYLTLERVVKFPGKLVQTWPGKMLAIVLVFAGSALAWIFFRAKNTGQAFDVIKQLFSYSVYEGEITDRYKNAKIMLGIAVSAELIWISNFRFKRYLPGKVYTIGEMVYLSVLVFACVFFRGPGEQFIYFQF